MNPTKEEWQKEVRRIYEKIKSHTEPYAVNASGKEITIFPNVFSPAYFTDSLWFAENIAEIVSDKKLLEIGTGTGIIALFCALNGANVTATDLNPDAIKNARYNFEKHRVHVETYLGDMYEPLPKDSRFDFIFWNHPFNKGDNPNEEILLKAGFDFQYQGLERYIRGAEKHLNLHGRILLGTGNFADLEEIERIAEARRYTLALLKKESFPIEKGSDLLNDYRIYELKRQP